MSVTTSITKKWICDFSEGSRELRELLGGKSAGIAEMAISAHRPAATVSAASR